MVCDLTIGSGAGGGDRDGAGMEQRRYTANQRRNDDLPTSAHHRKHLFFVARDVLTPSMYVLRSPRVAKGRVHSTTAAVMDGPYRGDRGGDQHKKHQAEPLGVAFSEEI